MRRELQLKIKSLEGAPRIRNDWGAHGSHGDSDDVRRLQNQNDDLAKHYKKEYEKIQKILTAPPPQQSRHLASSSAPAAKGATARGRQGATSPQPLALGADVVAEAEEIIRA